MVTGPRILISLRHKKLGRPRVILSIIGITPTWYSAASSSESDQLLSLTTSTSQPDCSRVLPLYKKDEWHSLLASCI